MVTAPRVCIVGAGGSGVAMAKALADRGVAFDCFERSSRFGGLWTEGDCVEGGGAAYRSLHLNSSKRKMEFSDFPMPAHYPDFPSRAEVGAYLAAYARRFGVAERIQVGRQVTEVSRSPCGYWAVRIDEDEERVYDVVLVASGYHSVPKLPRGAAAGFAGEVLHSQDVRGAAPFAGQRVLVVGFGNSAVDIASLVSTTAERTYLSTRRGTHVVPKYIFGRPFDELPAPRWPRALRWAWYGLAVRLSVGSPRRYGLPAPSHLFGRAAVTISSDLLPQIVHGKISPRTGVDGFRGNLVSYADGTREEVDTIIYCTGYSHSVPFLERNGLDPGKIGYRLFEQIWDPRFSGLAHIGLVQPLGSIFPIVEVQARLIADWITTDYLQPHCTAMARAIRRDQRRRERHYIPSDRHTLQVDEPDYTIRLERERRRGQRRAMRQRRAASAQETSARPLGGVDGPSTEVAF